MPDEGLASGVSVRCVSDSSWRAFADRGMHDHRAPASGCTSGS